MKKAILGGLFGAAALALTAVSAGAQNTNYPGMCTGYTSAGACYGCCTRLAPGNPECTSACARAFPGVSGAKAQMSPKRK